jgi:hypothetical protein
MLLFTDFFRIQFRIRIRIRIRIQSRIPIRNVYFGSESDPDPAKSFGSFQIRFRFRIQIQIWNTDRNEVKSSENILICKCNLLPVTEFHHRL